MDVNLQIATVVWLLATFITLMCEQALADVPPQLRREPTSKPVRPFSRVKLRCSAHPKEAIITWRWNGVDITDFPNIATNGGTLLIRNFESDEGNLSHVGNYQCVATTGVGSVVSRIARLEAAYIKKFTEKPPPEVLSWHGEVGVIPCTLPESKPPARMEYSFKNRWITESTDHHRIMPSGNLHILNVSSSDAGFYTCSAVNPTTNKRLSPRNGTLLEVRQGEPEDAPRIAYSSGAVVSRGDPAILECVVTGGHPTSSRVRWEKLTGDLSLDVTQRDGSLIIPSASVEDGGAYVCIAEYNGVEVDRQEVSLSVTKAPSIRTGPADAVASIGNPSRFSCSISRASPDDIQWLHNAKDIRVDGHKYTLNGRTLTINDVGLEDLGMYQCLVNTDEGSTQAAAQLKVSAGFPSVIEPPINTTAIEGERVYLSCRTRGEPLPLVTWEDPRRNYVFNTDKTFISEDSGGLTVFKVDLTDVGWYTCTVTNRHGVVKSSAYLSVLEKVPTTSTTPTQGVIGPPFSGAISDSGITTIVDTNGEASIKPGPPLEQPSKPQVVKIAKTSVEVSWTYNNAGNSAPITGFTVQYIDVRGVEGWRTASNTIGPQQRSYQVTNLEPSKIYRFRVIASNRYGESPHSDLSNRKLLESSVPVVAPKRAPTISPRIMECVPESSTTIRVVWEYPSTAPVTTNEDIEGFYVYIRNFDSDDDRDYVRTPIIGAHVRSYLIEKLEPEESYDIKVESFNSAGESKGSNVIIRSTLARETEPPPIIIRPSIPGHPIDLSPHIPFIDDDPTLAPPHPPRGQSEDILYITLGVVLGAMLLVLIMFAVMCVWRAKQVNRDSNGPVHWNNQPMYDGNFAYLDGAKYPYMNGKPNSNHSGPNGVAGRHNHYSETNGGSKPRPLYALPQDTLGGPPYIPCGTSGPHHDSAPETSTVPYEDHQMYTTVPTNNHHSYNSLTNGSIKGHHATSNHELGHAPPVGAPPPPRPVCHIRVNPRLQREVNGVGSASITVHDRPNRTGGSTEGIDGKDTGSLTLSLPTMPPDLYVQTTPTLSPAHSRICCEAHAPSRSRSASSQSEASSHHSSNQSESSHRSYNQSQLSSHHSSSSKITDV
ncbi:cell adhesion molecule-related/down-regulated by oncogenes-like [Lytechinus pictus]|uniref:cell adhesion molecule-related/down-regulated by oncogenes-like n=1 Tax=Lytechinus pictus TaxID=7653 RepID=UPI0030B9AE00